MVVQAPGIDYELLERIAERRSGAFEALIATYQDRLYGLALRVTGNREDAEEAVQDALVKVHRALFHTYSRVRVRELALRAWLFAVTLNAARNRCRRQRPSQSLDQTSSDGRRLLTLTANGLAPAAAAINRELGSLLEVALLRLPVRYRAAVVLRLVEGLSYQETAVTLGRPVGTVKSDVHRGLRLLRKWLGPLLEEGSASPHTGVAEDPAEEDGQHAARV